MFVSSDAKPVVYILSDSTGETAEFVVRAAAIQFNSSHIEIRRVPFVNDREEVKEVIKEAAESKSMIAYTLVLSDLRATLKKEASRYGVTAVDVMGPMITAFSSIMPTVPRLEAGLIRRLDEDYFRRIAAVEFAVKYDDGKDPLGLIQADAVLIGVSRTSKTPLSMYLAHRRLKVANFPLVPEIKPPEELFSIDPKKIIGLTIQPRRLKEIRRERLSTLGLSAEVSYASMERILEELEYAQKVTRRLGCIVYDVSNKAVEEVANRILHLLKEEKLFED